MKRRDFLQKTALVVVAARMSWTPATDLRRRIGGWIRGAWKALA